MFWNWLSSGIASQYYQSSGDDHNLWFFQSSHAFALTTSTLQSQENHSFLTPLLASLLYTCDSKAHDPYHFLTNIFKYIGPLPFCFPCSKASLQGSTGSIQNYISYVSMTELLSIIGEDQLSHCYHYKFASLVSRRLSILLNLLLIRA